MGLYRISRANKSNCKRCPLDGRTKVWGACDHETPKMAVLAEAPGSEEDRLGLPLVGPAGRTMAYACGQVGLKFGSLYKMNVIACRPPRNDISSEEALEAIECCREGFLYELEEVCRTAKSILVTGKTAMAALNIEGSVTRVRGSIYVVDVLALRNGVGPGKRSRTITAVPTFHPSYILRGQTKEEPTWFNDINKCYELSKKKYRAPREDFNLFPKVEDVRAFVEEAVSKKSLVAVDIETSGIDPETCKIIVIGLACDGERAISVPFYKQGGSPYWTEKESKEVKTILRGLFRGCPTVYQNALFDVRILEAKGFPVADIRHDTMLMHHCIHPELPKNLGYIVSIYGSTPYWKDVLRKSDYRILEMDDTELRTYNLRDSVVLHQVLPGMEEDLDEVGSRWVYENISMKLIRPVMEMEKNGIKLDKARYRKFTKTIKGQITRTENAIRRIEGISEHLNFDSPDDLRYLLYGDVPNKYRKAVEILAEYDDPACEKKKDTKRYQNALSIKHRIEGTRPLYRPKAAKRTTDSGQGATDEETRRALRIAANNRLGQLKNLKRPEPKHSQEQKEIERLTSFLDLFDTYKNLVTLLNKKYFVGKDGRVHGSYKIAGTSSGRLASGDSKHDKPNMQNVDPRLKKCFVPEEGWSFIQADYSNIELRVVAIVSEDDVLQEIFDEGRNVHTENCKAMFKIEEGHPGWKSARRACKTFIFGRIYGGTVRGIFERVATAVPELNLTFDTFQKLDRAYMDAHPRYKRWARESSLRAKTLRTVRNELGRVRILLGKTNDIAREGVNFPIQSLASDIVHQALIRLYEWQKDKPYIKIVNDCHDSLMVEVRDDKIKEVAKKMKKIMEAPVKLKGRNHVFPVEFEVGKDWGDAAYGGSMKEMKI